MQIIKIESPTHGTTRVCGLGRPASRSLLASLLLLATLLTAGGAVAVTPDLDQALRDITPQNRLRVTLADGTVIQGRFVYLAGDTLVLVGDKDADPRVPLPTGSVRRIEVRDSDIGNGIRWVATTGAVTVGALGGLMGWALASLNENGDSGTAGSILAGATLGAISGGLVVGGMGAGIGALSSSWVILYPASEAPDRKWVQPANRTLQLVLDASLAWDNDPRIDDGIWGLRLSLLKNLGRHLRMGPAVGYYNFEQSAGGDPLDPVFPGGTAGSYYSTDPVTNMGLDVEFRGAGTGVRPYAVGGLGWYLSTDLYLGAMGGGGLLWRAENGRDFHLEWRRHVSVSGDVSGGVDNFSTLSLGITFGNPRGHP